MLISNSSTCNGTVHRRAPQGEIEELSLLTALPNGVNMSIVGLAPALRRLKVIRLCIFLKFYHHNKLVSCRGIAADCDTLEEFGYSLYFTVWIHGMSTDDLSKPFVNFGQDFQVSSECHNIAL
jgi:hypothetical protein